MGGEARSAAAVGFEGRLKSLGLVFEDERKGCYSSGETVAGHVLLEAAEPVALRALRLEAQGRATAAWGPSAPVSAVIPAAASEVEYLNVRLRLREPPAGETILLLQPGKHEFPFSFQLPSEPLVTSFTGKYGSIQYCVRAVLERPKVPDESVKRELQVVNHIDVNTPALLTPVLKAQEKMVGCWVFTSGPVSLSAKIERKGYCNGEAIPIYAEIENCSSRLIVPKAAIFQTQTYLASGKTKTVRHMVANVRGNHIASGSMDTWNGKTLKIPPVTPSILDCCIIRVDYSLAHHRIMQMWYQKKSSLGTFLLTHSPPLVREKHAALCSPAYRNSGFSPHLFIQRLIHILEKWKRPSLCHSFSECTSEITCVHHQVRTLVLSFCLFGEDGGKINLRT
ncbi:arrestin domain-containing protein 4 isoform X2 [Choloepus didactylus]|uniref:arrestin domain-containing protein 4 isoform X2 n=1 Tax=Choloepus didactylus TaxID=27675 RepID=UPI0018A0FEE6|nr:arrestin domain-containing protein 4 isoform X2 [Choloepus didactylus]